MALAFEIFGPMAMFRRPYTTTSSVSFPLPPPTTIAGLLAGIIGLINGGNEEASRATYWAEMEGTQIALSVLNPISWYTGTINFWNLKEPQKSPHIRVKHQFLRNPRYRIYVQNGIEKKLQSYLETNTFVYTPCLGTAYSLAEIQYLGTFDGCPVKNGAVSLSSIVPLLPTQNIKIDIFTSKGIFKEKLPFRLSRTRALCETIDTLYPTSAHGKIHLIEWEGLDVSRYGDEVIAWFPAW